jgi:hypothetical protein
MGLRDLAVLGLQSALHGSGHNGVQAFSGAQGLAVRLKPVKGPGPWAFHNFVQLFYKISNK